MQPVNRPEKLHELDTLKLLATPELLENGAEIDRYFKPQPVARRARVSHRDP